jgi:hypothetical protein
MSAISGSGTGAGSFPQIGHVGGLLAAEIARLTAEVAADVTGDLAHVHGCLNDSGSGRIAPSQVFQQPAPGHLLGVARSLSGAEHADAHRLDCPVDFGVQFLPFVASSASPDARRPINTDMRSGTRPGSVASAIAVAGPRTQMTPGRVAMTVHHVVVCVCGTDVCRLLPHVDNCGR